MQITGCKALFRDEDISEWRGEVGSRNNRIDPNPLLNRWLWQIAGWFYNTKRFEFIGNTAF